MEKYARDCSDYSGIIDDLTPDDVRILVESVDEWHRASLGGFQRLFPIAGPSGIRLLRFLEPSFVPLATLSQAGAASATGAVGEATTDHIRLTRYYDILLHAFLTPCI
ncbi:unnamed protein product [Protopolystoma xenopodis]|uniref:Uncharacterized protein n=1 Tax=Protopolystoma xenopodis TaxID=117903 RepID=A0A448WHD0_9PLAT|nr:unnamed protein product [Protopolystoma xenopodis]